MVLTLYHDKKEPRKVFNCIKVSVDNQQTVIATVMQRTDIVNARFLIEIDYQRLTVQVD